ncbi:MAG: hypothetical protein WCU00_13500, partial [Candidatus Latescibacterota bacterium]
MLRFSVLPYANVIIVLIVLAIMPSFAFPDTAVSGTDAQSLPLTSIKTSAPFLGKNAPENLNQNGSNQSDTVPATSDSQENSSKSDTAANST